MEEGESIQDGKEKEGVGGRQAGAFLLFLSLSLSLSMISRMMVLTAMMLVDDANQLSVVLSFSTHISMVAHTHTIRNDDNGFVILEASDIQKITLFFNYILLFHSFLRLASRAGSTYPSNLDNCGLFLYLFIVQPPGGGSEE
jgi:hypothetical protein